MISVRIALRNLFRHRARSFVMLSAVAFGCLSLVFVGGYLQDTFIKMRESHIMDHTAHLQIQRRGLSKEGRQNPLKFLIENMDDVVRLVRERSEVAFVAPRLEFSGVISSGVKSISCYGQGIDPAVEPSVALADIGYRRADLQSLGGIVIERGEKLAAKAESYEVLLGKGLAASLGRGPGDHITLMAGTVAGSLNALDLTVKGIFSSSAKEFDDHFLKLDLPMTQRLLRTENVQTLIVMLKHTEETDSVKRDLERIFKERNMDLEVKTWYELNDFYVKTRNLLERIFLVLVLIIAVVVVLGIYNTLSMSVLERTAEIGTIMALGTSRARVRHLFMIEGALIGVLGGLMGVVGGGLLTGIVGWIGIPMPPPPGSTLGWMSEPMVVPAVLFFAFVLSVVTALLSAVRPAWRASRLEIADALRRTA